jgi:predicted NAD/FAD-binding protein
MTDQSMARTGNRRPRIGVVGSGVAGLTSAWLLQDIADVEIFESNHYLGGHTRTVEVPGKNGDSTPIDMGFIVMNHRNYPTLTRLFKKLNIALGDSDMSFSYHCKRSGYAYSGSGLRGLFANPRNLFNAQHWGMLKDVLRFNKDAERALQSGRAETCSLGQFIDEGNYGRAFQERYLLPMGAAIWSTPVEEMRTFPAASFFRFFHNHGLLGTRSRPQWKYVIGGSQTYVRAMQDSFKGALHLNRGVTEITRHPENVTLSLADGSRETVDYVVIASHADQALKMLGDASQAEQRLLSPWRYQDNSVVLHTDASVMPDNKAAWTSWNAASYGDDAKHPIALSYHMNRLQALGEHQNYFVSLNMDDHIDATTILHRETFSHPTYTFSSTATQADLPSLNDVNRTFFCGSYFGYGFHEDAVRSAADVAEHFEITL